jgi:NitT/TauT family transport system substrate-binding protein
LEIAMKPRSLLVVAALLAVAPARAEDLLKLAVPQRGAWDTSITDVGQMGGIFAKHGIKMEMLYTAGAGETTQAVISGSVDIGTGTGTSGIMAIFAKGAPIRPFSSEMTGADDIFWYVPANSPIKSLKDAAGKTIAFSATGSSSNLATLKLIKLNGVDMKAVAAGASPAVYTQVMSGQIDIGWAAAPFGIAQLEEGKIRIVARYNDIPEYRDMTARMHVANLDFLTKRPDVVKRFMAAYKETLDWMYQGDEAVETFAKFYKLPAREAKITRDQFYSRQSVELASLGGMDTAMADAIALKFIAKPLTKDEMAELLKYYAK